MRPFRHSSFVIRHFLSSLAVVFLTVLASCALLPTGPSPLAPGPSVTFITDLPKLPPQITLDSPSADWLSQGLLLQTFALTAPNPLPASEFSLTARLGYTDDALLLHVEVTDTTPVEAGDIDHLGQGDSIAFSLQPSDPAAGTVLLVAAPGRTAEYSQARIHIYDYRAKGLRRALVPINAGAKTVQLTPTRYAMNLRIPFAAFHFTPTPGALIHARFSVNNYLVPEPPETFAPPSRHAQEAVWLNHQPDGKDLPTLRLFDPAQPLAAAITVPAATTPAAATAPATMPAVFFAPACPLACYAAYADDLQSLYLNVTADRALAGSILTVRQTDRRLASATLAPDGPRAIATFRFPTPPPGQPFPALSIFLDNQLVRTMPVGDLSKLRERLFLSGRGREIVRRPTGANNPMAWLTPVCQADLFTSAALPPCEYPEPARIRALIGPYTIKTSYYDSALNPVTVAAAPGRYIAVTTVTGTIPLSARGSGTVDRPEPPATATATATAPSPPKAPTFTIYQTLFRSAQPIPTTTTTNINTTSPSAFSIQNSAFLRAAQFENPAATEVDARAAERNIVHALRKKLGTAIQHEYFVRLPKAYDADLSKRWPVIFYLHGSGGGGKKLADIEGYGPQMIAAKDPNYPFLIVSLRTPGGWSLPAVNEVIAEVQAKYRIDPDRMYLTGFSMGAIASWELLLEQPQRFAAAAVVGSYKGDPDHAAVLAHTPIWVINGALDSTTLTSDVMPMVRALQAAGAPVKFTEIPNADHVDSHTFAYQWPELYAWFLEHRRQGGGSP